MLNIYEGTLGQLVDTDSITQHLIDYQINFGNPLNYNIEEDKTKVVCLLGINDTENKLPVFNHPLIYKDHRDNNTIAGDYRLYTKSKLNYDDILDIRDSFKDRYNGMLQLKRLIFNKVFLDKGFSPIYGININLMESFAAILDQVLISVLFDKNIFDPIHLAAYIHWISMDDERDDLTIDDVIHKMPRKYLFNLMNNKLTISKDQFINIVNQEGFKIPSRTIYDLLNNISMLDTTGRLDKITVDMLIDLLAKTFFGLNRTELAIGMVEHKPTFLSILHTSLTEGMARNTLVKKTVTNRKMLTKPKDIVSKLDLIINSEFMD